MPIRHFNALDSKKTALELFVTMRTDTSSYAELRYITEPVSYTHLKSAIPSRRRSSMPPAGAVPRDPRGARPGDLFASAASPTG